MKKIPAIHRILSKVLVDDNDCWLFQGCINKYRYGSIKIDGIAVRPHRYVYGFFNEEIPDDKDAHHLCGMPDCCNPAHIEVLTHDDHMLKHRSPHCNKCKKELSLNKHGKQKCKSCEASYSRAYYKNHKEEKCAYNKEYAKRRLR